MSHERYFSPQENQHLVYGPNDLSLRAHDVDALLQQLEDSQELQELYYENDPSVLPQPITEMSIIYDPKTPYGESYFGSTFRFDPQLVDSTVLLPQEATITELQEQLKLANYDIQQAAHQQLTLRVAHVPDYSSGDSTYFILGEDDQDLTLSVYFAPEVITSSPPTKSQFEAYIDHWNIALRSLEALGHPEDFDVNTLTHSDTPPPITQVVYPAITTGQYNNMPTEEVFDETESRPLTLDDIGGAHIAKQFLKGNMLAIQHPELAKLYGMRPSSFMLYGPPGTGKTSLAEAFANDIDATLTVIASTGVIDKWVGSSGKNLEKAFSNAKSNSSLQVLFFDEFDSLAGNNASNNERDDVKNILKREISEVTEHYPNIIIAAATNKLPDDMDPALVRAGRIEPVQVPIPTEEERREIWGNVVYRSIEAVDPYFNGTLNAADVTLPPSENEARFSIYAQLDFNELTALSDGYTGADISAILHQARLVKFIEATNSDMPAPVTQADILDVLKRYQKP